MIVKTLLRLITQTESLESLKKSLMELQDDNLQHLTTTLNIENFNGLPHSWQTTSITIAKSSGKLLFSRKTSGFWRKYLRALAQFFF